MRFALHILIMPFVVVALAAFTSRPSPLPQNGPDGPVVISNRVVYAVAADGNGKAAILCIDHKTQKELWRSRLESSEVWTAVNGAIIASSKNRFYRCDLDTGRSNLIFEVSFSPKNVIASVPGSLLVLGQSERLHELSRFETTNWTGQWSRTNIWRFLHQDANGILVLTGTGPWQNGEHGFGDFWFPTDNAIMLLSPETGRRIWGIQTSLAALPETTLLLPDCVLVSASGLVTRFSRIDGATKKRRLAAEGTPLPLWIHDTIPCTIVSNQVCELNARTLEPKKLFSFSGKTASAAWQEAEYVFYKSGRELRALDTKGQRRDFRIPQSFVRWSGIHDGQIFANVGQSIASFDLESEQTKTLYSEPILLFGDLDDLTEEEQCAVISQRAIFFRSPEIVFD
jgi:hypothetical protein